MTRIVRSAALAICGATLVGCGATYTPWVETGSMSQARAFFSAAVLPSGKVLVAGGEPKYDLDDYAIAEAEVYDPATEKWSPAAPMLSKRTMPCAVTLPTGKVLVMGGANPTENSLKTAELYDPATGNWTPTSGSMAAPHDNAQCTMLPSGKVLIVGGLNYRGAASVEVAELYDPATDTFTTTGSLEVARYWFQLTVLQSGKVLATGGCVGSWPCEASTPTAELYDPVTGAWSNAGKMPFTVMTHTATLLPSGKVLVAGGCVARVGTSKCGNAEDDRRASLYDPNDGPAGEWSATGSLPAGRADHVALLLDSGNVLVVGGGKWSSAGKKTVRYDVSSGTWSDGPPTLVDQGNGLKAVRLRDGRWMIMGGAYNGHAQCLDF